VSSPSISLKALLTLAWPIIVSRSTQVVVGLADALMVAHLGETVLAAVTTGAMNSFALFIFPMGIAFLVSSFSSQLTGRDEPAAARRFGWYGLGLALATQAVMLALLPAAPWALGLFGYEAGLEQAMLAYLSIRLLSVGTAVGIEALGNYYGGTGNTAIYMKVNIGAMLLNVALNWLLIDGNWGFPALGLIGAAWASVAATSLAFAGFLAAFLWHGRPFPRPRLNWHEFGRLLRFGLPSGLNWSFEFFAFIAFINIVVAGLGTSSLAAFMAVIQLNSAGFMPVFGLSAAGAILVGQCIGSGHRDRVPGVLKLTFLTASVWMLLLAGAYVSVPGLLLQPFVPGQGADSAFMQAGVTMLMFSALWQLFDAAGISVSEALRAAGDTSYTMWARGGLAWGVFLPGSYISVRVLGYSELAAVAWLLAYLGLLSLVLYLRFRSGAWRRIELVEEAPLV
jgi:multidrug resistance protein, MATE family